MRAVVLHAHPDDELLFAGALMLSRPHWEWTTVSLTGGERASMYPGVNLGHEDEWRILTVGEYGAWKESVEGLNLHPDVVFTHNRMGEYGHPHHMAVHRIAHEVFDVPIWDFLCEAPSSVGDQLVDVAITQVKVTQAKADRLLRTYGEATVMSLWEHQPYLMEHVLTGPEVFSGPYLVPS